MIQHLVIGYVHAGEVVEVPFGHGHSDFLFMCQLYFVDMGFKLTGFARKNLALFRMLGDVLEV